MDILEKLFGGPAPVKVMRLFLFNPEKIFEKSAVSKQAKISTTSAAYELNLFKKIGFVKLKSFFKEGKPRTAGGPAGPKKRVQGYMLNTQFKYITPLQRMLIDSSPMEHKEIANRLSRAGKVRLILISGVFIQEDEARVDLMVVGDDLSEHRVRTAISNIEAEIGRQLRYTLFETNDFQYRRGLGDRLMRDIFDYPHQVVLDKIGLETVIK